MVADRWKSGQRADVVAYSSTGEPVLIVEVTSREPDEAERREILTELMSKMSAVKPAAEYGLLVGPTRIQLIREVRGRAEVLSEFDTTEVLRLYDPDIASRRLFHDYFESLVEAWLRDVAYRWKSPRPPAIVEFESSGVADRVSGGTTRVEVALGDPVS